MSGTGERLKTIRRIRAVQERLKGIEQRRLLELSEEDARLQSAQQDLVGALNEDQALHGRFIDLMARRIDRLAEQRSAVEQARIRQAAVVFEHGALLRNAESRERDLERQERRIREDGDLRDLGDLFAGRPRTSLP